MKSTTRMVVALALLLGNLGNARADIILYASAGYNQPTGQFGTVDVQTGVFTQTGTLPAGVAGGDMARLPGGPLYAVPATTSNLLMINPATAGVTTIGNMGNGIESLAFSPTGTLYGFSLQNMYQINPMTGAATLVGNMGNFVGGVNEGISAKFAANGTLYLEEENGGTTSSLYNVNTSTGLATLVGPTGYALSNIYDDSSGLYGFTLDSKIVTLNTQTGAGTFLANESGASTEIGAVAAVPEPSAFILVSIVIAVCFLGYYCRRRKHAYA